MSAAPLVVRAESLEATNAATAEAAAAAESAAKNIPVTKAATAAARKHADTIARHLVETGAAHRRLGEEDHARQDEAIRLGKPIPVVNEVRKQDASGLQSEIAALRRAHPVALGRVTAAEAAERAAIEHLSDAKAAWIARLKEASRLDLRNALAGLAPILARLQALDEIQMGALAMRRALKPGDAPPRLWADAVAVKRLIEGCPERIRPIEFSDEALTRSTAKELAILQSAIQGATKC